MALIITVNSFSYLSGDGIPPDPSGHGGGFVFDCRSINNPGRYEKFKHQTGRDEPVIHFLQHQSHMNDFLHHAYGMVDPAIENFIERKFTSIVVNFGCTGGQHRSVYAADQFAKHIQEKYQSSIDSAIVKVKVKHVEQEKKQWKN